MRPEDAPSLGAWSLLRWARQYRNRFFQQLLPKAMAVNVKQEEGGEVELKRQERKRIDQLEGVLKKVMEEFEAKLAADTPGTVNESFRSRLDEWKGRFGLNLPQEASQGLEIHMAHFVGTCIAAAVANPKAFRTEGVPNGSST